MMPTQSLAAHLLFFMPLQVLAVESVEVSLKVVGEENQPVANAMVAMSFLLPRGANEFRGRTNPLGEVSATRSGLLGVGVLVEKPGYYASEQRTGYGDQDITLLLRERKNPIPMYAKRFSGKIPENGRAIGFDFTEGDWVSPYGSGNQSQVLFEFEGDSRDFFNYRASLKVSFPNESDGIVAVEYPEFAASRLRLPYAATDAGYEGGLEREISGSSARGGRDFEYSSPFNHSEDFGYFLRVNSAVDKNGNLRQANYAKIRGDVVFGFSRPVGSDGNEPAKEGLLTFTYYYNPKVNDLNVEFDTTKNLLTNLEPDERVLEP